MYNFAVEFILNIVNGNAYAMYLIMFEFRIYIHVIGNRPIYYVIYIVASQGLLLT